MLIWNYCFLMQISPEEPPKSEMNGAGKALLPLSFASFTRMLGVSIVDLILVIYAVNLGADAFLSGIAVGAFSLAQVLLQIPIGRLSDKIGRKKTIQIGVLIYAIGTGLCGFAQNIYQLIAFRFIAGSSAYISVIQAFLGDLFGTKERGRAMSYYSSGVTLGYAVGLPLGGLLASLFLNLPFFVNFMLAMASFTLIHFFVDEPQGKGKINNDTKINWRDLFRNRLFLITIGTDCMSIFVFSSLLVFITPFARSFGYSTSQFSLIMVPLVLIMISGFIIGGKYSYRLGRSNAILIGFLIAGPLLLAQTFVTTPVGLVIIAAFMIFGIGIAWTNMPALILDSVPDPACRATATSVYNTIRFIGNAIGPVVIGYIIGLYSPDPTDLSAGIRVSYLISGAIYLVACLIVFFFLRKYERQNRVICESI
jgi:MFS family permease